MRLRPSPGLLVALPTRLCKLRSIDACQPNSPLPLDQGIAVDDLCGAGKLPLQHQREKQLGYPTLFLN